MTTERYERIPELTLGWRLKMSLGEVTREDIARVMDVTPSTISRWMADKGAPPRRPYLIQWALATSVSLEWLMTGHEDAPTMPPTSERAWRGSNPQPSDPKVLPLLRAARRAAEPVLHRAS